jgi:VIT1/CCC1 family predicted Fe2+/Mn2+ transporter
VPSKKQRRRREKSRRHEYEYVYVDDEGQEVEVDPAELQRKPAKEERRRTASGSARPVRKVNPPSWSRAIRVGGLFAAAFVVIFTFVLPHKKAAAPASIALALVYGVAFVPMIYFTDRMKYRAYLRQTKGQS